MYVTSKRRKAKRPQIRYKTRTVYRNKPDKPVIVIRGDSHRESRAQGSVGGSGALALGILLIGGAAGALYYFYSKSKCDQAGATRCLDGREQVCSPWPDDSMNLWNAWQDNGATCDGGSCTDGQKKCVDDIDYICQNGEWALGGDACGGGYVEGIPCSVVGSGYCEGGKYFVCEAGGVAVHRGVLCGTEVCNALRCSSANWKCGGVVEGDTPDDYYYDYRCDPQNNRCNFMQVEQDSQFCMNRVPGSASVLVNNKQTSLAGLLVPIDIKLAGDCPGHSNTFSTDHANILVNVKDTLGNALGDALVTITAPDHYGGFVNGDGSGVINCSSYSGYTDANGQMSCQWLWTWLHSWPNNVKDHEFTVTITKNGVTIETWFILKTDSGGILLDGWSCEGIETGSDCKP